MLAHINILLFTCSALIERKYRKICCASKLPNRDERDRVRACFFSHCSVLPSSLSISFNNSNAMSLFMLYLRFLSNALFLLMTWEDKYYKKKTRRLITDEEAHTIIWICHKFVQYMQRQMCYLFFELWPEKLWFIVVPYCQLESAIYSWKSKVQAKTATTIILKFQPNFFDERRNRSQLHL